MNWIPTLIFASIMMIVMFTVKDVITSPMEFISEFSEATDCGYTTSFLSSPKFYREECNQAYINAMKSCELDFNKCIQKNWSYYNITIINNNK